MVQAGDFIFAGPYIHNNHVTTNKTHPIIIIKYSILFGTNQRLAILSAYGYCKKKETLLLRVI